MTCIWILLLCFRLDIDVFSVSMRFNVVFWYEHIRKYIFVFFEFLISVEILKTWFKQMVPNGPSPHLWRSVSIGVPWLFGLFFATDVFLTCFVNCVRIIHLILFCAIINRFLSDYYSRIKIVSYAFVPSFCKHVSFSSQFLVVESRMILVCSTFVSSMFYIVVESVLVCHRIESCFAFVPLFV